MGTKIFFMGTKIFILGTIILFLGKMTIVPGCMGDSIFIKKTPHNIFIMGTRKTSTEMWRREGDAPLESRAIVFMFYWNQLTFRSLSGSFKHEWGVKSMHVGHLSIFLETEICLSTKGGLQCSLLEKKTCAWLGLKQDMLRALWFVCWLLNGCQWWSRFNIVSDSVWQVAGCNSHTVV